MNARWKLISVCLGTFSVFGATGIAFADVNCRGNFETGDIWQWSEREVASPDRIYVVNDPLREGYYAAQVNLYPGDYVNGGHRAELVYLTHEWEGSEFYYRWSTLFPWDFPSSSLWQVFTQWKQEGCCRPPIEFAIEGETIRVNTNGPDERTWWNAPLVRGQWHDFIFHVRWSSDPWYGFIELWYGGNLVIPQSNVATMNP